MEKNRFFVGTVAALVGAFVGVIPFLLVYVFANYIVAILTALIAVSSYYFYKLTKAKIDKKLPVIVAISSFISITVAIFIIMPLVVMVKEDITVSIYNLERVYKYDEVKNAIVGDYLKSLIFAFIGVGGIVTSLKKQIKEGKTADEIKLVTGQQDLYTPEEKQIVKDIFERSGATNKENGITKDDVIQELNTSMTEDRAKQLFNILKTQGFIRKKRGRFYYCDKQPNKKAIAILSIIFVLLIVIASIALAISFANNNLKGKSSNSNSSSSSSKSSSSSYSSNKANDDDEVESEKEFVIKEAGMKFVPTKELTMVSGNNVKKKYGKAVAEKYDMIAANSDETSMIICYIIDDAEDYTAREFLEEVFDESDYEEIKTEKIAGFEFDVAVMSFERGGDDYKEYCYVYKVDDELIVFDYFYLEDEKNDFSKMIKKQ